MNTRLNELSLKEAAGETIHSKVKHVSLFVSSKVLKVCRYQIDSELDSALQIHCVRCWEKGGGRREGRREMRSEERRNKRRGNRREEKWGGLGGEERISDERRNTEEQMKGRKVGIFQRKNEERWGEMRKRWGRDEEEMRRDEEEMRRDEERWGEMRKRQCGRETRGREERGHLCDLLVISLCSLLLSTLILEYSQETQPT